MKSKRDDCPEAPLVLRAIGLDIESMDKGVSILCRHQQGQWSEFQTVDNYLKFRFQEMLVTAIDGT